MSFKKLGALHIRLYLFIYSNLIWNKSRKIGKMEIATHYTQRNKSILLKKCRSSYIEFRIYNPLLGEPLEARNCASISVASLVTSRMLLFLPS